ncbi:helix-turn-helix transcriptional regulator [Bdellovibrio sp. HCB2-146]|uniref:helix-turn-helix transcriptional regulator n=1 Tax=Bdellovibrio sp. HCB2-146 TaxID=3394362 RepID=UPI0039BD7F75
MIGLHANQKKILEYLLDHSSGATLDEIAKHLGITKTAAKEHVIKIENLGLLSYEDIKGGVGRPRRHYLLSSEGHEVFPRQYSWLSNVLLEFLAEDVGSASLSRMMESLAKRVSESMKARFEKRQSTADLLVEITKALNELGYRAQLKQSDLRKGAVIEATNCVYHSVAKAHPELCRFDTKFIESASGGMNVKLESCIARGGAVCRFCIRKLAK